MGWFAASCAAAMIAAAPAAACSFHTYLPERTAVDWMVDSADLVLARPDPQNEFVYKPVDVLRGKAPETELGFLVDSVSRQKLASHPDEAVLFARGSDGAWNRVAYVDTAFREVMERVIAESPSWGAGVDPARFAIAAELHDHPDPKLRKLALRELDQAPYALLRDLDLRLPPDVLLRDFWTPQEYPYQPIRVLLLGLDDTEAARVAVRGFAERAAGSAWASNLGAYATALIEQDGAEGVALLEERFLADPRQPLDKLELVVEALAIQNGVGSPDLRDRISAALEGFVAARPEGAALVARQFFNYQDWSQAAPLAELMHERRIASSADLMAVAIYVAQARRPGSVGPAQGVAEITQ